MVQMKWQTDPKVVHGIFLYEGHGIKAGIWLIFYSYLILIHFFFISQKSNLVQLN